MFGISPHFPLTGLIFIAGAIAFLKSFDKLASLSARRLLELSRESDGQDA